MLLLCYHIHEQRKHETVVGAIPNTVPRQKRGVEFRYSTRNARKFGEGGE